MIGFLIALVSGALMSIQGVFNTQVTKSSGIWTASAFVQFTALLVCLGAWLCTERTSFLKIAQVEPKYMLLGGAIGAFITYTVIRSMDVLGPAKAVMLIVIAQLAVAYICSERAPLGKTAAGRYVYRAWRVSVNGRSLLTLSRVKVG